MSSTDTVEVQDVDLKHSVYTLADKCDVAGPDTRESAGVRLLERIQDAANEVDAERLFDAVKEYVQGGGDAEEFDLNDLPDDLQDEVHEQADSAVQIYTHQCWQEFSDLALWQEDLSELGDISGEDLTRDVAMRAQYIVARRSIPLLIAERAVAIYQANPDLANPVVESPSGWSYRESQENGDNVDCQDCGDPLDDDQPIVNDAEGYAFHEGCLAESDRA